MGMGVGPNDPVCLVVYLVKGLNGLYAELSAVEKKNVDQLLAIIKTREELTDLLKSGDCGDGPLRLEKNMPRNRGRKSPTIYHRKKSRGYSTCGSGSGT